MVELWGKWHLISWLLAQRMIINCADIHNKEEPIPNIADAIYNNGLI